MIALLVMLVLTLHAAAQSNDYFVFFGTYTGFKYVHHSKTWGVGESKSKGVYVSRFNASTGQLSEPQLAAEVVNPSFLTISPDDKYLYAISEDPLSIGPPVDHSSYVSAYAIDPVTGKLRFLNSVPASGTSTCYISIDKTGRYVMLANFGSGSVSIFHFDKKSGMLSPPGPPSTAVYPGGGPRHFTFDPSGKFGCQLSEMSGIVDVFSWDPTKGTLTTVQRVHTVPHNFFGGNHSAEIEIHPSGRFLYESNRRTQGETVRGPDTIGVFAIDQKNGTLSRVEEVLSGGTMPRNFALDPTGNYLLSANQLSNNIVVFKIDSSTGRLTKTGNEIQVDTPVCIKFVPAGK